MTLPPHYSDFMRQPWGLVGGAGKLRRSRIGGRGGKKEAKRSGKEIKRRGGEKEKEGRVEKAEGTTFTLRGRL